MYKVKSNSISITLTKVKKGTNWTDVNAKKDLIGGQDKKALQKVADDMGSVGPKSAKPGMGDGFAKVL